MTTRPTRRRFLLGAAAALSGAALSSRSQAAPRTPRPRPHYLVRILLSGGYDAVMSVDPKVGVSSIDGGFNAAELLKGKRRVYGPLLGELLRHEESLALVHGVRSDTVSHGEGHLMVSRGRLTGSESAPPIGDLIGAALPGDAPFQHLSVQDSSSALNPRTPRSAVSSAIQLDPSYLRGLVSPVRRGQATPSWDEYVTRAHQAEAQRLFVDREEAEGFRRRLSQSQTLVHFLRDMPRKTEFQDPDIGDVLETTLYAIRGNWAKHIAIGSRFLWLDSHTDNEHIQRGRLLSALNDIARFIDRLKAERNEFGSLYDQTTIAIGSELGRFPRLNAFRGKDHWPENSWILCGRGLRAQEGGLTIGRTDDTYRGMEIDFRTGLPEGDHRRPIYLDNVFATLLQLAGGRPQAAGYRSDQVIGALLG